LRSWRKIWVRYVNWPIKVSSILRDDLLLSKAQTDRNWSAA
jgi:hypothetical protein